MYYSNSSIGPGSYFSMERSVYSGLERDTFSPKYSGSNVERDFYSGSSSNISVKDDKDENEKKRMRENSDVVFVKDDMFDLFLRFSPLLRSLESKSVKEMYSEFILSKGKLLLKFLKGRGRRFIDLVGFSKMKLDEHAIAAVVRTGNRAILALNLDFEEKIFNFSKHNRISVKDAMLYVFCHETVHLADEMSEKRTEILVGDFFSHILESEEVDLEEHSYEKLKKIAYLRSEDAEILER